MFLAYSFTICGAPPFETWCVEAYRKRLHGISGHKTDSIFARYNIVSEADIRDAARKIEEGANAAVSGSIHSSFIVEAKTDTAEKDQQ